jgi:DNA-binding Lrp family transcriptional regulator
MESIQNKGFLSEVDRELLKELLNPNGKSSSLLLSKKLGIPKTTIQRRRKRLEKEYLQLSYSLNLEKFRWRRVDLLIATRYGKTSSVAKQLLSNEEVTYVGVNDTIWSEIVEVVGRKRSIPSKIIDQL